MSSPPKVAGSPTGEVGYDGKPISSAAARLPQFKKSGDATIDQQRLVQRTHMIRIVDQLLKEPKYILPLHAQLVVMDVDTNLQCEKKDWTDDYKFLNQIPRAWLAEFILQEAQKLKLAVVNLALLSSLESEGADNLPTLFSFMVQLPLSLGFPNTMRDAYVAKMVFRRRCADVGDRLAKFIALGGITVSGSLDMKKAGCFVLEFDGETNMCNKICHITGLSAVPPAHAPITRGFSLVDNTLDAKASVILEPRRDLLYTLSKNAAFENTMWMPNKKSNILRDLAAEINTAVEKQDEERAAAARSSTETMQLAAQKRAEAQKKKARDH